MSHRTALPLIVSLVAGTLYAEQRAQVTGVIKDPSDAVLTNVAVTIVNSDTGIRRSTRSDDDGTYTIASLPAGLYKMMVRREGFQTVARLNIDLEPAQNARLDFTMQIGSIHQVVTINDGPRVLNTDDGSVGVLVGRDWIDRLPLNGGGVLGLLDLASGVVSTPAAAGEAGQFSANGQRANTNYFTVDGVSANSSISGGPLPAQFAGGALPEMAAFGGTQNLVNTEGLQEAQIQTSSFAPEFGRVPGVHIGLTTRSGSNELHGSVFYSLRNEKLNGSDWFGNRYGFGAATSRLNDWGGSLGGPVRRDRTFFFASYEGLRLVQPFTMLSVVPSLTARVSAPPKFRPLLNAFPLATAGDLGNGLAEFVAAGSNPARLDAGSLRVDHALNMRHSLFARYNQAPSSSTFGYSQVDASQYQSHSLTLGLASMLMANLNNDLRVNVSSVRVASHSAATGAGGAMPLDFPTIFPEAIPETINGPDVLYGFGIGDIGQILSGDNARSKQDQWNVVETLAINHSRHGFRLGVDYERLTPQRDRRAVSIAGRYGSLADLLAGLPLSVTDSRADAASSLIETLSLFMQDTWRVHSRLTMTYGSRWELTPAPTSLYAGSTGGKIWPTRYSQFAPRVGLAWRVSEQSVLRAGWGIFYDLNFSVATDPINGVPFNRWQFTGAPVSTAVPLIGASRAYGFAPNLKLPYSTEWSVAYERALTPVDVLSLSYVGSAGHHLLRREGSFLDESQSSEQVTATNHGDSRYHGLEAQYRRKMARGVQGTISYTWSHSLDNGSSDSGLYLVQSGSSASRDWGSSAFDVRHFCTAAFSWDLPGPLRNWSVEGILRARSGFPVDVLADQNVLGLGFDDVTRPDLVPGRPIWSHDSSVPGGRRLNPAAFSLPSFTMRGNQLQGNLGRNAITGFGFSQLDLGVRHDWRLRNESIVQLRIEGFNALNHPSFGDPVRFLTSPLFGQATSMLNLMLGSGTPRSGLTPAFQSGGPRVIQIGVRWRF